MLYQSVNGLFGSTRTFKIITRWEDLKFITVHLIQIIPRVPQNFECRLDFSCDDVTDFIHNVLFVRSTQGLDKDEKPPPPLPAPTPRIPSSIEKRQAIIITIKGLNLSQVLPFTWMWYE